MIAGIISQGEMGSSSLSTAGALGHGNEKFVLGQTLDSTFNHSCCQCGRGLVSTRSHPSDNPC